jgi:NAD(P)-dependent dehydrogenase (short-subunit alcohol dehydrogenase family)
MRVVVIGGTSGIGLAAADQLTKNGIEVTVAARDMSKLSAVSNRFAGAEILDMTDRDAVAAFFESFGPFEHLVLAASPGAVGAGPLKEVSIADIETAVTAKLLAYLYAIQQASVSQSITMVSAASARAAAPGVVALAAANGAIERIVSPLATELAPVRVNAVSPGVIDTPWWSFMPDDQRQAQLADWTSGLPAGRPGTAHEVATAITYLIGASYVTGTILPVDGGFTIA